MMGSLTCGKSNIHELAFVFRNASFDINNKCGASA